MNARLDLSGYRVLCAVIDCGAELGKIYFLGAPHQPRGLVLEPGYGADQQGVFRYRPHAARRVRYTAPDGSHPRRAESRRPNAYHTARGALVRSHRREAVVPSNLPRAIACQRCGMRQTLDPEALAVYPALEVPEALDQDRGGSGCPATA